MRFCEILVFRFYLPVMKVKEGQYKKQDMDIMLDIKWILWISAGYEYE